MQGEGELPSEGKKRVNNLSDYIHIPISTQSQYHILDSTASRVLTYLLIY